MTTELGFAKERWSIFIPAQPSLFMKVVTQTHKDQGNKRSAELLTVPFTSEVYGPTVTSQAEPAVLNTAHANTYQVLTKLLYAVSSTHTHTHTHTPTQTLTSALLKHTTMETLEPRLILVRSKMSTLLAQRG